MRIVREGKYLDHIIFITKIIGRTCSVTVIVAGNGHGELSSNPE